MLCTALFDGAAVSAVIELTHFDLEAKRPNDFVVDPRDVARRAEAYMRRLARRRDLDISGHDIVAAAYGGLCVYAMEYYSMDYTHLARLSTKLVADAVAGASGDPRLDIPKRRMDLRSRMPGTSIPSQVVRLSELMTVAQRLVKIADADWLKQHTSWGCVNHAELSLWTEYAYDMMVTMQGGDGALARGRLRRARRLLDARLHELHARTRVRKLPRSQRTAYIEKQQVYKGLDADRAREIDPRNKDLIRALLGEFS